ncbi:hypothetical protein Pint_26971 [Pistacia integerrima]|uniref:Uncharacterized protein n=1 Tax=Pistacia integerrima TaxID=434235 RepID=A0ACC0YM25_9ROSI|nr:hypothetical protein Pint_26971 [Pistacia integerrima]
MASIKPFSPHLQSQFYHPKTLSLYKSPFISLPHKHKPQKLSFTSHVSHKPGSKLHCSSPSVSSKTEILKFLQEKVVTFVVGSVIFLGCFGFSVRPGWALPGKMSKMSENLGEKSETQMGEDEEEEMCERVLKKEPRNVEALKVVVYGKMRRGRTQEAVKYVERLIEIEPREVEWRLLQALCYEMMGQLSKAKRLFKEILKRRPLLLRALHGLAMVMHKNHEGPAVFEMLIKALEVARREKRVTEERNIRILIAQMHVMKGMLEEGLKQFQDLVNENPRDFRPYLCQGIIYSLLDKKEEAAEQFEIYRSLVPDEFPERGFMDDVVFAAKTKSRERLKKEFEAEFSYKK